MPRITFVRFAGVDDVVVPGVDVISTQEGTYPTITVTSFSLYPPLSSFLFRAKSLLLSILFVSFFHYTLFSSVRPASLASLSSNRGLSRFSTQNCSVSVAEYSRAKRARGDGLWLASRISSR